MLKKTGLLLTLLLLSACGNGRDISVVSYRQAMSPTLIKDYVVVRKGDNLYTIAMKNKLSVQELVKKNGVAPPFFLNVGQKIYLPKTKYHRVKKGDTLYSLSRFYNVRVNEIARLNKFSTRTRLKAGVKINIPRNAKEVAKIQTKIRPKIKVTKTNSPPIINTKIRVHKVEKAKQQQKDRLNRVTQKTPKRSGYFIYPVHSGKIISEYGRKSEGVRNDGINISVKKGASVRASENGVVVYTGSDLKSFGNVIMMKHGDDYVTVYAHLNNIVVKRGAVIKQGVLIGHVGTTGNVVKSQLHFQIRQKRRILNPKKYLR